uniref:RNA-dependent RNA polymerase n=1 Tax=Entomophthora muscae mitovirus 6 TaxID=2557979 RepID=A0A499WD77_9VIRU|nr:TPA_inf: RNA-dependent RNA polymerase [Entomophthora muscae mitovirus 6]
MIHGLPWYLTVSDLLPKYSHLPLKQITIMDNKITNLNLPLLLSWIKKVYYPDVDVSQSDLNRFDSTIQRWIKGSGLAWTVSRLKQSRNLLTKHICEDPDFHNPGIAVGKSNLPRVLPGSLRAQISKGDPRAISFGITLLSVGKMSLGGTEPDTSTITDKWSGRIPKELQDAIPDYCTAIGQLNTDFEDFHWTLKKGPGGDTAIHSAMEEFRILSSELIEAQITLAGDKFEDCTEWLTWNMTRETLDKITQLCGAKPKSVLRRIATIPDKEMKTRVIANLDYWSQTALKPLHNSLMSILKRLPADMTYKQDKAADHLPKEGPYFSYDLSAATDRFPIEFQYQVLSRLIGKEKADAWKHIMVDYPFRYKGRDYRYATGQPMGAYSSWALFALCHHIVVYASAKSVGKRRFIGYALLGDDIVIADREVAEKYLEIMTELGVQISPTKSHVSAHSFEFAKQWYHKGKQVSPFPMAGLQEVGSKYHLLFAFLEDLHHKGITPYEDPFSRKYLFRLFHIMGIKGIRLMNNLRRKLLRLSYIPSPHDDKPTIAIKARSLAKLCGIPLSCNYSVDAYCDAIGDMGMRAVSNSLAKEVDRAMDETMKWTMKVEDLIMEHDLPLCSDEMFAQLPLFRALDKIVKDSTRDVKKIMRSDMPLTRHLATPNIDIWGYCRKLTITPYSASEALAPVRTKEIQAIGFVSFVDRLVEIWGRSHL